MGYREDIENKFSDGILLLKEFIYSEYRLPMTIKEERNLYNVYYESVTAWENGTMTECRKNLFLSIFPEGKYCTPTELSEKLIYEWLFDAIRSSKTRQNTYNRCYQLA